MNTDINEKANTEEKPNLIEDERLEPKENLDAQEDSVEIVEDGLDLMTDEGNIESFSMDDLDLDDTDLDDLDVASSAMIEAPEDTCLPTGNYIARIKPPTNKMFQFTAIVKDGMKVPHRLKSGGIRVNIVADLSNATIIDDTFIHGLHILGKDGKPNKYSAVELRKIATGVLGVYNNVTPEDAFQQLVGNGVGDFKLLKDLLHSEDDNPIYLQLKVERIPGKGEYGPKNQISSRTVIKDGNEIYETLLAQSEQNV